jgi:hypothetical protein
MLVQATKMKSDYEALLVSLHQSARQVGGELSRTLSPQQLQVVGALIQQGGGSLHPSKTQMPSKSQVPSGAQVEVDTRVELL